MVVAQLWHIMACLQGYLHCAREGILWPSFMKTSWLHYWHFVRDIHQSLVDSPHQGPVMLSFDIFFDVSLNKPLNKQLSCQWFDTHVTSYVMSWQNNKLHRLTSTNEYVKYCLCYVNNKYHLGTWLLMQTHEYAKYCICYVNGIFHLGTRLPSVLLSTWGTSIFHWR